MSDSYKHLRHARTVLIGLVLLCTGHPLFADTTWVSGAVRGTWTWQGSPYMIADSAWVNAADTLLVSGGTEIVLPNPQSLLRIKGVFKAVGQLSDSVFITLAHSSSSIRGPLTGRARRFELNFANVSGIGFLNLNVDSTFLHSSTTEITDGWDFILRGNFVGIRHSKIFSLNVNDAMAEIQNTSVGGAIVVMDGGIRADSLRAGTVHAAYLTQGCAITNSDIYEIWVSNYNIFNGIMDWRLSRIRYCRMELCRSITVEQCQIARFEIEDCGGTISKCILDSLSLRYSAPGIEPLLSVRNNTFVDNECCLGWSPRVFIYHDNSFSDRRQLTLTNNIFYARRSEISVFKPVNSWNDEVLLSPPSYNIVYGMSDPWGGRTLGWGNRNVDPLFDPNSEWYNLLPTSPAINRGNPDYQDPDSTVSDIGAGWWDHRFDHPPIITIPNWIDTRWGDSLTLRITACDDHFVTVLPAPDIPQWFRKTGNLDFNSDLLFSGRIPFGVRSFNIPAIAIDNIGQRDEEIIHVEVHPRSDLPDTISGTLTRDYSPYVMRQDVVVMADDSLTVEPGVHVQAESQLCSPTLIIHGNLTARGTEQNSICFETRPGNYWNGILVKDSTGTLDLGHTTFLGTALFGLRLNGCGRVVIDSSELRCVFSMAPIRSDSTRDSLIVRNCSMPNGPALHKVRFIIEGCLFSNSSTPWPTTIIGGGSGTIRTSIFQPDSTVTLQIDDPSEIIIERCIFQGQGEYAAIHAIDFSGSRFTHNRIRIYNNIFFGDTNTDLIMLDSQLPGDTIFAEVINNIFMGPTSSGVWTLIRSFHQIVISNNCFWQCATPVLDTIGNYWPGIGIPSTVNANGDSTDPYGNIFLNPLFADSIEYCLSAASPCIDAGLDIGLPFFGSAPDMGRCEWMSGAVLGRELSVFTQNASFTIFPNPTNGRFIVTLPHSDIPRSIVIYNILGQALLQQNVPPGDMKFVSLELPSSFSSGQYFILVKGAFSPMIKLLVIIK